MNEAEARRFLEEREEVEEGRFRFRLEEGGADMHLDLPLPWERRRLAFDLVLSKHTFGRGMQVSMPSISECIKEARVIEAYLFGAPVAD